MTSGYFNFLFALINLITKGSGNADELKKCKKIFYFFYFFNEFHKNINEIHRIINEIHRIINEIHKSKPKPTSVASENVLAI